MCALLDLQEVDYMWSDLADQLRLEAVVNSRARTRLWQMSESMRNEVLIARSV